MPDPLVEAFDLFDQRIQPSATQRHTAESRGRHVVQLLSQNYQILECRLVGSLVRSTAIRRYSDIDILAVFDPRKEADQVNSENLLDMTAQIITSSQHVMKRTPTIISLHYPEWPSVDILPALPATTDGKNQAFRIPAGTSQAWRIYIPSQHDRLVRHRSEQLGPRFKIIIRAMKWWNRLNGNVLQSHEIEGLVSDLFVVEIPEYTEVFYRIFSVIMAKVTHTASRKGHEEFALSAPCNVQAAWALSQQALNMAKDEHDNRELEAIFRRLFGDQFSVVCS